MGSEQEPKITKSSQEECQRLQAAPESRVQGSDAAAKDPVKELSPPPFPLLAFRSRGESHVVCPVALHHNGLHVGPESPHLP